MRPVRSIEEKVAVAHERYRLRTGRQVAWRRQASPVDSVVVGRDQSGDVSLPVEALLRHMHVIGTTGAGKSNFLNHLIRQLIDQGYGVCLLDPHGGHKDGLIQKTLAWLATSDAGMSLAKAGKLHIIDPNTTTHVTGFNPLARPDDDTALSVIADAMLEAFERVWGEEDTHAKPTIRRVLKGTFHALAEHGLTLAETDLLYDPEDRFGVRALILSELDDQYARWTLERLHRLGEDRRTAREFDAETVGPINRIADFLSSPAIRAMVGQTDAKLDFREILDGGHVMLANLQDGSQVSAADTDLLGRMLLHALFFHCKRRETHRPFIVIVDECHRMLSGDVAHILTEARKFGVGIVLANQFLNQIQEAGERIFQAVRANTATKVVFRIADMTEAKDLAHAVIPLDTEMPVRALVRPAAVAQEIIRLTSAGKSEQDTQSVTDTVAHALGEIHGETETHGVASITSQYGGNVLSPATGWFEIPDVITQNAGEGSAKSRQTGSGTTDAVSKSVARAAANGISRGQSISEGISEALRTVYQERPSAVHSLDTVLYMAARSLNTLKTGAAFVAHQSRASIVQVPLIPDENDCSKSVDVARCTAFKNSSASTPIKDALRRVETRRQALVDDATERHDDEGTEDFTEPYIP